jgi:hypothetical protein
VSNVYLNDRHEHRRAPWYGRVQIAGKRQYLGYHATREQAATAVKVHRLAAKFERMFPELKETK